MTDQEINVAIAEACGWRLGVPRFGHDGIWRRTAYKGKPIWGESNSAWAGKPHDVLDDWSNAPNYCSDLNAMHEAEKPYLTNAVYWLTLSHVVLKTIKKHPSPFYGQNVYAVEERSFGQWTAIAHATAPQRAEAFLRTLGKWREG